MKETRKVLGSVNDVEPIHCPDLAHHIKTGLFEASNGVIAMFLNGDFKPVEPESAVLVDLFDPATGQVAVQPLAHAEESS